MSFTRNATVLFVDVALQPEARFIAKQNSLMKIGNNGNLVWGPFDESTPCLMIVLMNCQTKLRINHLTAVKSVAILEKNCPVLRNSEKANGSSPRIIVLVRREPEEEKVGEAGTDLCHIGEKVGKETFTGTAFCVIRWSESSIAVDLKEGCEKGLPAVLPEVIQTLREVYFVQGDYFEGGCSSVVPLGELFRFSTRRHYNISTSAQFIAMLPPVSPKMSAYLALYANIFAVSITSSL
ncbi:alpha-2 adrenergic receptor [Trichonephila clavipes]|nr:alpha-2 adrenergic receptor [Trichonephila clavipes]